MVLEGIKLNMGPNIKHRVCPFGSTLDFR